MNEMKASETQLRSWAQRRPSRRVKRKLFGAQAPEGLSLPALHLRWLAPASAAVLIMAAILNPHNSPALRETTDSRPLVAMILSNQSSAAYLPHPFNREQNGLPTDTFEWTNLTGSTSSMRSLSSSKGTN